MQGTPPPERDRKAKHFFPYVPYACEALRKMTGDPPVVTSDDAHRNSQLDVQLFATYALHDVQHVDTCLDIEKAPPMIRSFKDKTTEAVFNGKCPKGFPPDIFVITRRKLRAIEVAAILDDLKAPPGNKLKALIDDRKGQHSIRVNDQFRICFKWTTAGVDDVEFTDYH